MDAQIEKNKVKTITFVCRTEKVRTLRYLGGFGLLLFSLPRMRSNITWKPNCLKTISTIHFMTGQFYVSSRSYSGPCFPVFSPNAGKYGSEYLGKRTHFTNCKERGLTEAPKGRERWKICVFCVHAVSMILNKEKVLDSEWCLSKKEWWMKC